MENSGNWLVKLGVGLLVIYTLGFILFAVTLPRPPALLPHADGIVALTGGDARLDAADKLLENDAARRLLISGVNPGTTKAQLKALAHAGRRFDCCADLGFRATSTHGNADEATAWVRHHGYNSIIVVTANYHMRRSLNEFSADMPGVRLIAYPVDPQGLDLDGWWQDPHALHLLHSEYAKYLASFVITHFRA
ncbi:MAG TPA: YdcF family protein [Rhizomicrobium sp.]|jgi:uncharacterized SAM-binding protein YcdF (DUF218 family)